MASMRRWSLAAAVFLAAQSQGAEISPAPSEAVTLGVQIVDIFTCPATLPPGEKGICVAAVRPGGAADRAGLRSGDVIMRIGTSPVTGQQELQAAMSPLRVDQTVEIHYRRGEGTGLARVHFEASDRRGASPAAGFPTATLPQTDACEATLQPDVAVLKLPFRKLPLAMDAESLKALLGDKPSTVALQGDVLTLAFRAPGNAATVSGGIQCALDRLGDTDLWALQLQMPQWQQAFLSADFLATGGSARGLMAQMGQPPTGIAHSQFRGSAAPPPPAGTAPLHGSLATAKVPSRFLGTPKEVSVYLPPMRGSRPLPVLYMTDGQWVEPFAALVEALIESGRIRPIAIVAEHSGRNTGDVSQPFDSRQDNRSREYLPDVDPRRFANHMQFFVDELLPWAEKNYGLSGSRVDRAAMGYSNGGAFVSALGAQHPESFASVLPFSPADRLSRREVPTGDPARLPRFFFAGGELEPNFLASARTDAAWLQARGVAAQVRSYWSGHDTLMWQLALAEYLPTVFPPGR